jgi:hypothetical protein
VIHHALLLSGAEQPATVLHVLTATRALTLTLDGGDVIVEEINRNAGQNNIIK